jgi:ATP-dependent exoDNAse (exonuclease V) beta subunit
LLNKFNNYKSITLFELIEQIIKTYSLNIFSSEIIYIQYFQNLILDISYEKNLGLTGFIKWWYEEGNALSVNLKSEIEAINVTTIHRSKGLAFDVVIIPFCDWGLDEKKGGDVIWCKSEDEPYNQFEYLPMPNNSELKNTLFYRDAYKETIYSYMDALNLLYVACTRAREVLNIWSIKPSDSKIKKTSITNISDLLYFFMYSSELMGDKHGNIIKLKSEIFQLINDKKEQKRETKNKKPTKTTIKRIKNYPVYYWENNIKAQNKTSLYFTQLRDEENKLEYGKLMHHLLSKIRYSSDIENVLKVELNKDAFYTDNKSDIKRDLLNYISFDAAKIWFNEKWNVLTEKSIITHDNDIKVPDRVIYDDESTLVIEFKFAEQNNEHNKQLNTYVGLLKTMKFNNVKGFLYYPAKKHIIAV